MNWENLKYLLAFYRGGSLAGAANRMGVDATTVSRRLSALQDDTGVPLIERASDGALQLTAAGMTAVKHSETVESALLDLNADLTSGRSAEVGVVRISTVPMVINKMLLPKVREFTARHPGIELHLASQIRNVSLTKRETDMAIRLGRPQEGGYNVKTKRIAVLKHGVYGPARGSRSDLPWICYHESMRFLPQARWMEQNLDASANRISNVRPSDLEGVIEAIAAGLGRSVLPTAVADADTRLVRLEDTEPALLREVWLLQHADQIGLARMTAVSRWLETIFSADPAG